MTDRSAPTGGDRTITTSSGGTVDRTTRVTRTRVPIVVGSGDNGGLGRLPVVVPSSNPQIPSGAISNTTGNTQPAVRQLTVQANGAIVPVNLGGPLPCGGFIIYAKQAPNGPLYMDVAFCEGEIQGLANFKFGGKALSDLGLASPEIHLGVAGEPDTANVLIREIEPTYTVPQGIAHAAFKLFAPTTQTGDYDPFSVTAEVTGLKCYDDRIASTVFTKNPIVQAIHCFRNSVFGPGADPSTFRLGELEDMENGCDVVIGTDDGGAIGHDGGSHDIKRWELTMRCDQQDTFENWLRLWGDHCGAIFQYNSGQWGGFLNIARSRAVDADGNPIVFRDYFDDTHVGNLSAEAAVVYEPPSKVPTVLILKFTDSANAYAQGTVMEPPGGPTGGQPWIEQTFTMNGIVTIERARRWAILMYNLMVEASRTFTLKPWALGLNVLPGDRVGLDSRQVIPASAVPPNAGAVAGVEEVTIVDVTVGGDGVVSAMTAAPYRDAMFSDTIDTTPGPIGPPHPDPYATPDDPSHVSAPHSGEDDYGLLYFAPALSPFQDHYEILDLYGDPAIPPIVGTVKKSDPLTMVGGVSVYTAYVPSAIHGTKETGRSFKVMVRTVTAPANKKSGGVIVSWTVGSVLPPITKKLYGYVTEVDNVCDPHVLNGDTGDVWSSRGSGSTGVKTVTNAAVKVFAEATGNGRPYPEIFVSRTFIVFDPTVLPDDAVVTELRLGLYGLDNDVGVPDDDIVVVASTATNPHAVGGDMNAVDLDPTHAYARFSVAGFVSGGYNVLVLDGGTPPNYVFNAGNPSKFDRTLPFKIALLCGHDFDNNEPVVVPGSFQTSYFERLATGTENAQYGPRLYVVYTSASEGGGGTIITGGQFQGMKLIGTGDGVTVNPTFTIPDDYIDGSHTIFQDGEALFETTDYTRSGTGLKTINYIGTAPNGVKIGASYAKVTA